MSSLSLEDGEKVRSWCRSVLSPHPGHDVNWSHCRVEEWGSKLSSGSDGKGSAKGWAGRG